MHGTGQVEELRREIEILSQNHEREVDRKDAIVQVCTEDACHAQAYTGPAQTSSPVRGLHITSHLRACVLVACRCWTAT